MMVPNAPGRCALGVSGFVVLFILFGGFIAMHGVASTSATGVHHSGITLAAPASSPAMAGMAADSRSDPTRGAETDPGSQQDTAHGLMIGCLVALCGTIVVAALLRLVGTLRRTGPDSAFHVASRILTRLIRPPPRPSHISLCVLRV